MDLRFSDGPESALPGYLRVEDAVNALGRQEHPDEWGQLPGWELMPFRRSKKLRDKNGKRPYVRHKLTLTGNRGNLHSIPIKLGLKRDERRACTKLYRSVRKTLQHGLAIGALKAQAAHHGSGKLTPLDRPGIWTKQAYLIFFTGKAVLRDPPAPDIIADVLIAETVFKRWLEARRKSQAANTTRETLRAIGQIIITHGAQHGYDITLPEAWGLINDVARQHNKSITEREFKNQAWKQRQSKAGRKKKMQKLQGHHETELRALIAERLASAPAR